MTFAAAVKFLNAGFNSIADQKEPNLNVSQDENTLLDCSGVFSKMYSMSIIFAAGNWFSFHVLNFFICGEKSAWDRRSLCIIHHDIKK
jgi:hypothetical protein